MYPEQGQYINIHAHRGAVSTGEWVLQNISAIVYSQGDDDPGDDGQCTACSVGLHPWDLDGADADQVLKKVEQAAGNPCVLAIGEAGLDRMVNTPMDFQEEVFRKQVEIAETNSLPVIIHAVKTYQELIGYAKEHAPSVPMIIHGFRGSSQLAGDLLKYGFILSFGASLLKSGKATAAFRRVSSGKFFLETDESDVPINEIYAQAARIRSISIDELQQEQQELFNKLFRKE